MNLDSGRYYLAHVSTFGHGIYPNFNQNLPAISCIFCEKVITPRLSRQKTCGGEECKAKLGKARLLRKNNPKPLAISTTLV